QPRRDSPMEDNTRNYILAILLSLVVLATWQLYFAPPPPKEPDTPTGQQQSQQAPSESQSGPRSLPGSAPPRPQGQASAPAVPGAGRQAALSAAPRVKIDTPRLRGSLSLRGGRIDDLVLKDYKVTVEPSSPQVTLL